MKTTKRTKETIKRPELTPVVTRLAKRLRLLQSYRVVTRFLISSKDSKAFNWCLVVLIASFYVLRAHPYIAHPQLYAEDGEVWLSGGYNNGLKPLFQSYNGLLHSFDRVFGILTAHLIPLSLEPVVYVLVAFVIFLLLCYYLFSSRTALFSSNYQKLFMALSLCLLGNAEEFYFSFSNSVFLLGIIGLIILIVKPPKRRFVDILERILFLLMCFTLVFCWIYVIILAFEFIWQRRRRYYYAVCAIAGSLTQYIIHSHQSGQRPNIPNRLLASKATLIELYNQIITPSLRFGRQDINPVGRTGSEMVFVCVAFLVTIAIVAYVFWRSNYAVKCLLFFCLVMTLISLKSPVNGVGAANSGALVIAMATYHWSNRYFIYGILGLFVVWAKFSQELIKATWLPSFITVFFVFGVLSSITLGSFFIQKDFVNLQADYTQGIKQVGHTKKTIVIPINPQGWVVVLKPK